MLEITGSVQDGNVSWPAPVVGLSTASVPLVAALGLAITFGLMGVINMAHGEVMAVGSYTAFMAQGAFGG